MVYDFKYLKEMEGDDDDDDETDSKYKPPNAELKVLLKPFGEIDQNHSQQYVNE